MTNLIVQKYGGATLATPEKIKNVAKRIAKLNQSGKKVVVVVSAMGKTTNDLISLAHQVSERPKLRELDMLLSVGERISMSLLSMALNDLNCDAISLTGSQAGIITDDLHINAQVIDVKPIRVEQALAENKIVILAGFQGVSATTKEVTTLGRGGSDITAVSIAAALKAERCEILKDVSSLFTADPKVVQTARPILQIDFDHLLELTQAGTKVLHESSVQLAKEKNVSLYIGSAEDDNKNGTIVTSEYVTSERNDALAISTHSEVFKLKLKTTINDFQKILNQNQVGQIKILHQEGDVYYITAPSEILNSLSSLNDLNFKIQKNNLCSVSLTFKKELLNQDTIALEASIKKINLDFENKHQTKFSIHFFIELENKNNFIKALHQFLLA